MQTYIHNTDRQTDRDMYIRIDRYIPTHTQTYMYIHICIHTYRKYQNAHIFSVLE